MADDRSSVISNSVEAIRNAVYGKDVRNAIANGIELCYNYVSGQEAMDAAIRATEAVDRLQTVVDNSEETLNDLNDAVESANNLVVVSETQPTDPGNKIWIKPRADTEYRIATFEAYSELWDRVNAMNNVYEQGHGGIVSVDLDENYEDEDPYKKKYVITFSDGTTSNIFLSDGRTGSMGPIDTIESINLYYCKGVINNGVLVKTPPTTGWTTEIPNLSGGDYLWSQTLLTYSSGRISYLYGLSRQGTDGSGSMNSVKVGQNGAVMTGDVVLPFDYIPTAGHVDYLVSSDGVRSAIDAILEKTVDEITSSLDE